MTHRSSHSWGHLGGERWLSKLARVVGRFRPWAVGRENLVFWRLGSLPKLTRGAGSPPHSLPRCTRGSGRAPHSLPRSTRGAGSAPHSLPRSTRGSGSAPHSLPKLCRAPSSPRESLPELCRAPSRPRESLPELCRAPSSPRESLPELCRAPSSLRESLPELCRAPSSLREPSTPQKHSAFTPRRPRAKSTDDPAKQGKPAFAVQTSPRTGAAASHFPSTVAEEAPQSRQGGMRRETYCWAPAFVPDAASSWKSVVVSVASSTLIGRVSTMAAERSGRPEDVSPLSAMPGCQTRIW